MLLSLGVNLGLSARVQLDVAHPTVVGQEGGGEELIRPASHERDRMKNRFIKSTIEYRDRLKGGP